MGAGRHYDSHVVYRCMSGVWGWGGIWEEPFQHCFGNQIEFILPLLIVRLLPGGDAV